jgi:hypothetical protein
MSGATPLLGDVTVSLKARWDVQLIIDLFLSITDIPDSNPHTLGYNPSYYVCMKF